MVLNNCIFKKVLQVFFWLAILLLINTAGFLRGYVAGYDDAKNSYTELFNSILEKEYEYFQLLDSLVNCYGTDYQE